MSDPARLLDPSSGTSPAVRDLLAKASAAPALSPEVKARMAARIAQAGVGAGAAGTTALVWKGLFGAGVVGLAAVLFVVASHRPSQLARAVHAPEVHAPDVVAPLAPRPSAPPAEPLLAQAPVAETPAPTQALGEATRPVATDSVHPAHATAAAHAAPTSAAGQTDEDEVQLLNRAQRLIDSDPTAALALAREHATRFPRGQLIEERERIEVRALARAGRTQEARTRGEAFLRRHPDSIYASPVRDLLRTLP